jgi:hypothetical protein
MEDAMKTSVSFETAKVTIQKWFNEFCKFYGKPTVALEISEEGDPQSGSYEITNPSNGKSTKIFKSTVADYEDAGSVEIPGELKGGIWDSFQDL